jgi:hypothetical protein
MIIIIAFALNEFDLKIGRAFIEIKDLLTSFCCNLIGWHLRLNDSS